MFLRALVAFALALVVITPVIAADKKNPQIETGVVVAVKVSNDKKEGTLTVKVEPAKKKKNTTEKTEATEKKFSFTKETLIVKLTGKKKTATTTEASAEDLKAELNVTVSTAADGKVEKIAILEAKKKKKDKK